MSIRRSKRYVSFRLIDAYNSFTRRYIDTDLGIRHNPSAITSFIRVTSISCMFGTLLSEGGYSTQIYTCSHARLKTYICLLNVFNVGQHNFCKYLSIKFLLQVVSLSIETEIRDCERFLAVVEKPRRVYMKTQFTSK